MGSWRRMRTPLCVDTRACMALHVWSSGRRESGLRAAGRCCNQAAGISARPMGVKSVGCAALLLPSVVWLPAPTALGKLAASVVPAVGWHAFWLGMLVAVVVPAASWHASPLAGVVQVKDGL